MTRDVTEETLPAWAERLVDQLEAQCRSLDGLLDLLRSGREQDREEFRATVASLADELREREAQVERLRRELHAKEQAYQNVQAQLVQAEATGAFGRPAAAAPAPPAPPAAVRPGALRRRLQRAVRKALGRTILRSNHFDPARGLGLEPWIRAGNVGAVHRLIRYVWAQEVLVESGISGAVVDLGCGTGYGTHGLARRLPGLRFVGVDTDPSALARARTREPLPNLELRLAEPPRWPGLLGEGAFGGVLCFDLLHRIDHPELLLEAVVRTMPPGGWFLASAPCASDEPRRVPEGVHYSAASLHDLLSRYFRKVLTPDAGTLPQRGVFDRLRGTRAEYLLRANPVIGQGPIVPANPYRP